MMHATNSDMIPVREMTASDILAQSRKRNDLRRKEDGSNYVVKLRRAEAEIAEKEKRIEALERDNAKLKEALEDQRGSAAEYYRTIMHYVSELDKMSGIDASSMVDLNKKTVKSIIMEVLRDFPGINYEDILSARRTKALIVARHKAMFEVYKQRPDLSFPQIGMAFKRDHTSILAAVRKMEKATAAE